MSRIGKQPIKIPEGVKITVDKAEVTVEGPRGTVKTHVPQNIGVVEKDGVVTITGGTGNLQGLTRTLLANAVKGVTSGWSKTLELSGTGYRASVVSGQLQLAVGFSHPVTIAAPEGIEFSVKENKITVTGANREIVGLIAARVRKIRPADPYKAKGFIYEGVRIVRKAGKAAKAGATTK